LNGYSDFVKKLIEGFEKEEVDYAFTGALAASFYGVPRTTADVDVIVAAASKTAKTRLGSALRLAGLQVDEKRIDDALTSGYRIATFNCKTSPYTVDVIFSDEVRKRVGAIADLVTYIQPAEDLILAKLRMIKATVPRKRAVKDEADVRAILQFTKVENEAIEKQAKKDGTLEIWENFVEG
jgi:hypothetical protein